MAIKYFDGILAAQRDDRPIDDLPAFDIERLRGKGWKYRLASRVLENPRWLLALSRRFKPFFTVGGMLVATRAADVREILERQDVFQVPFGPEMTDMAGGSNFILGMQDGSLYRRLKSVILSAFPPDEVEMVVRPIAQRHSREIALSAPPGFNVVADLLNVVPVRICRDYFGLGIENETAFAEWSVALSSLFFADPSGDPATRELARVASDRMLRVIDRSIDAVREGRVPPSTPLARLVAAHDRDPAQVSLAEIRAIMMGMVAGFGPTNLLASANALDVILSKPEAQEVIERAIAQRDDKLLDRAIMEAMRFKPINIGPVRYTASDAVVADGTARRRVIKAGTVVMPSTLSAMFDPDAVKTPDEFRLDRPGRDYLVFGHGIHWCIGSAIAKVQIAESLRALFGKAHVRRAAGRAGRLTRRGAFPESLCVTFDVPPGNRVVEQSMVTIVVPVTPGVPLKALRDAVDALGNPAAPDHRDALDRTGVIHFCSLAVACRADPSAEVPDDRTQLVFELSADGTEAEVIAAFATALDTPLRPILETGAGLAPDRSVEAFLTAHSIRVRPWFSGHAGLLFCGTPGHSVGRIRAEADLERTVGGLVREVTQETPRHALATLREVRSRLAAMEGYDWAFQPAESRIDGPGGSPWKLVSNLLLRPAPIAAILLLAIGSIWINMRFVLPACSGAIGCTLSAFTALLMGLIGFVAILAVLGGLLLLALRRAEARDVPGDEAVELGRYEAITARENQLIQNNLTAISIMKPGLLRHIALRFVLYVIQVMAAFRFRPGHLADINTIHFARWVLLPGTDRLMFFSNFGGSWESYLEDFITKATKGLTGAWSNTQGFPRTRNLFLGGAHDGDRFKRWARMQQIPTLFWYAAYGDTNTARIRINAAIRRGLATARTENEARAWLDLFGSLPRPADLLESGEIQTIFFGPLGRLERAELIALRIPDGSTREQRAEWLADLVRRTTFGDLPPEREATVAAFGPRGLNRLGLHDPDGDDMLASFPLAFRQGMASHTRTRILDDVAHNAPAEWLWGNSANPADIVVVCYGLPRQDIPEGVRHRPAPDAFEVRVADVVARAIAAGFEIADRVTLTVKRAPGKDQAIEHFGFADGISQPVVKGTPRAHRPTSPQHMVEAGEFLFGYRDQRQYFPPSPVVRPEHDPDGILPQTEGPATSRPFHDFGRNGSFMVVRELQQHVEAFDGYCRAVSERLSTDKRTIDPKWVGAKMVGRWQDGSSLVRNPYRPGGTIDNSFTFGPEDPQGTRCPLGSHVRRSNPRDSLGVDRSTQIDLSKRHRIMRIGRTYERDGQKGLMFMCLNADIERQFEFVQQTWVASGLFHGLRSEKDPVIGTQAQGAHFTIPSPEGGVVLPDVPNFVTTRGGGYFFMPSRRAMQYMLSRLQ